jgi:hypothetical protein
VISCVTFSRLSLSSITSLAPSNISLNRHHVNLKINAFVYLIGNSCLNNIHDNVITLHNTKR